MNDFLIFLHFFTISFPGRLLWWVGVFLVFCLCVFLVVCFWLCWSLLSCIALTGPSSDKTCAPTNDSLSGFAKDCHYHHDERSNSPPPQKKMNLIF